MTIDQRRLFEKIDQLRIDGAYLEIRLHKPDFIFDW